MCWCAWTKQFGKGIQNTNKTLARSPVKDTNRKMQFTGNCIIITIKDGRQSLLPKDTSIVTPDIQPSVGWLYTVTVTKQQLSWIVFNKQKQYGMSEWGLYNLKKLLSSNKWIKIKWQLVNGWSELRLKTNFLYLHDSGGQQTGQTLHSSAAIICPRYLMTTEMWKSNLTAQLLFSNDSVFFYSMLLK